MADGVGEPQPLVRAAEEHAADASLPVGVGGGRSAARESPQAHEFRVVSATLLGMAAGAIVIAGVILATGSTTGTTAKWSSWAPADGGTLGRARSPTTSRPTTGSRGSTSWIS